VALSQLSFHCMHILPPHRAWRPDLARRDKGVGGWGGIRGAPRIAGRQIRAAIPPPRALRPRPHTPAPPACAHHPATQHGQHVTAEAAAYDEGGVFTADAAVAVGCGQGLSARRRRPCFACEREGLGAVGSDLGPRKAPRQGRNGNRQREGAYSRQQAASAGTPHPAQTLL
jgi:hypothetical protein